MSENQNLSFKLQVKKDLCMQPFEADGCLRAELSGLLTPTAVLTVGEFHRAESLLFNTDSSAVAIRVYRMAKYLTGICPGLRLNKDKTYEICFSGEKLEFLLKDLRLIKRHENNDPIIVSELPPYFAAKQRYLKAYIRGVFLACGAVMNPEKGYRIELSGKNRAFFGNLADLLTQYDIKSRLIQRRHLTVLYMKESESVATFLKLIGANKAFFEVEDIRVLREVRNNVNRKVNCELSNINKSADAADKQMAIIQRIEKLRPLDTLPAGLKALAVLRKENPDASIKEIGEMLTPPLGKSGVYKRFEKLGKIAESLEKKEGQ